MQASVTQMAGAAERLRVPLVVKGEVRLGDQVEHRSRAQSTPVYMAPVGLDDLIWSRQTPTPAFDTPIAEIIDFLVEVGTRLDLDTNPYLQQALSSSADFTDLDVRILENGYRDMQRLFGRTTLTAEVEQALGGLDVVDGWVDNPNIPGSSVRAIPPRMIHVLAGNAPVPAPLTIVRGALSKGVHLLKLPSNDMFTATAILRTMADVDPHHPTTRSFSAAYWRGGDAGIESAIYRSQYFDKIVVWGGEAAVRHVIQYISPGFEMISFDPKVSVSMIGREAHASDNTVREVAARAAADIIGWNQDACAAPRFQFVEGSEQEVDRFCEALTVAMGTDTRYGAGESGIIPPPPVREQLDALSDLEPMFRLFGKYDGRGLVIRSSEPVPFTPANKLVNVVRVDALQDAVKYLTVATQTVGVYPHRAQIELRDRLAAAGAQVIVSLGKVYESDILSGKPHDATLPLNRFMRWVSDNNHDIA